MRSKEQKIAVADRLLEAYRARQPGYRKHIGGTMLPVMNQMMITIQK